ncbi:MAG: hypothetical protein QNK30_15325 [Bacteroidales bacterium]|nr:hypothetical protein [Bacteroidales bacterium]
MIRRKKIEKRLIRNNRQTIMLNRRELNALDAFCEKYKISNRSKFMRETIITTILKKFDEDHPSLFQDEEPNLFSKV